MREVDKEIVRLVGGVVISDIEDWNLGTKHGFEIELRYERNVGICEWQDRSGMAVDNAIDIGISLVDGLVNPYFRAG
jgi:hypothetical protein